MGQVAIGGEVSGTGASAVAMLAVSKTVNTQTTVAGANLVYIVTVRNLSSIALTNVVIRDPPPAGLLNFSWTCTATNMTCPTPNGSGAINESVAVFPASGELAYTLTATVAVNHPPSIRNVVTVTPDSQVVCAPSGTPVPCGATAIVTTGAPLAVPVSNPWLLLSMALSLLMFARRCLHR